MITKDNFLLKKSQQEIFDSLSNEEAGILIKGIFKYVSTGDSGLSGVLNAVFIPIKNDIDENEAKYRAICERNKQNGLNGGRPRKDEEENPKNPVGYSGLENEAEKTQVDNLGQNTHISYNHISLNHNNHNINKSDINNSQLDIIKNIIEHLNLRTNSNYRYTTKTTQDKIKARLNEGFTLDDFIVVIDKKTMEWINDSKMSAYLRPETLFGTKFESYLNQPVKGNGKKTLKDISMSDLDRAIEIEKQRSGMM